MGRTGSLLVILCFLGIVASLDLFKEKEINNQFKSLKRGVVVDPVQNQDARLGCLKINSSDAFPPNGWLPAGRYVDIRFSSGETHLGRQFYHGTFKSAQETYGGFAYGVSRKSKANMVFALDWAQDGGVSLVTANYCARDGKWTRLSSLFGEQNHPADTDLFGWVQNNPLRVPQGQVPAYQIPYNDIECTRGVAAVTETNCLISRETEEFIPRSLIWRTPFCFRGPARQAKDNSMVYQFQGGYGPYISHAHAVYYEGYVHDPQYPSLKHKAWAVAPQGARDVIFVVDWKDDPSGGGVSLIQVTFKPYGDGQSLRDLDTSPYLNAYNSWVVSFNNGTQVTSDLLTLTPCI